MPQICMDVWIYLLKDRKHWEKKRKCWLQAVFIFPHNALETVLPLGITLSVPQVGS